MKLSCLVFFSLLLVSSFASGNTASNPSQKKDAAINQRTWLVKMTASVSIQERELSHTVAMNSVLVSEKIVTYHFLVRSGGVEYKSEYTPSEREQPGNLPHAWWEGNAPVSVRIVKQNLFIKLPDGREVQSGIIRRTALSKSS